MDEPVGTGASNGEAPAEGGPRAEPRWPMALAVLVAVGLQVGVSHRGRVPGWWVFPVLEVVMLGILVARDPGRIDRRTKTVRRVTIALIAVITVANAVGIFVLLYDVFATVKGITAGVLFGRGGALWVTNVIVFGLWFWELDRGGPAERAAGSSIAASFAFPENAMPELAAEAWAPTFPDYLYLSFTNATAFSPTDTLPVATWAKMTMMIQAAVSLVTAILVIARAINILPG
jgi:uncharacterized membrane protein